MKVIAFAASTSKNSINKALATYTAHQFEGANVEVLDLNDYSLPLFSEDLEKELGQPQAAKDFLAKLASADVLVASFAEHNGSYAAAFKNLFDWCSRIDGKVYQDKPMIALSTSPGGGGARSVLEQVKGSAGYFGSDIKAAVSVGSFYDVFDMEKGEPTDADVKQKLKDAVAKIAL